MDEFVKPKTVIISDADYIQTLVDVSLKQGIKKDLHDNEEICQHCHGTGMVVVDNRYGLSNDPDSRSGQFPYLHQSISFCPHCYNGVVRRCPLCGELIKKGWLVCDCDAQREIRENERQQKLQEAFDKAPTAPKEVIDEIECFYSESYTNNGGYFFDWSDFFENWFENHQPDDFRPSYVWITEPVKMSIDAWSIVKSETEELYEDAFDDISSGAIKELQDFIDDWCRRCGVGTTYHESHKYKVQIPWEDQKIQK